MKDPGHAWNCYDETDGHRKLSSASIMLQFNFIFGFNLIFFCFGIWQMYDNDFANKGK